MGIEAVSVIVVLFLVAVAPQVENVRTRNK
jgi:hypothetical protein